MADLARRIAAVDLTSANVDADRVKAAFSRHLNRLGLKPRPVWWEKDVASVRHGYPASREAREWWLARSRCRAAAQAAGWRPSQGPNLWETEQEPRFGVFLTEGRPRQREVVSAWLVVAVWENVEALISSGDGRGQPLRREPGPDDTLPPNPLAPWLVDALLWSTAPSPFSRAAAVVRWTEACTALVDAYEAGLGFFWVLADWIVAVPRPALSVVDGALHSADGPAVSWPDGERYWFWRGLRVPQRVVEEPERLEVADVHNELNVEVRSVLLERMGFDRYVREGGGRLIAKDGYGRLWRCRPMPLDDEPLVFVEVENATREPDGSGRRYFLRVPPTVGTPHEAVAWSFGLSPSWYAPSIET